MEALGGHNVHHRRAQRGEDLQLIIVVARYLSEYKEGVSNEPHRHTWPKIWVSPRVGHFDECSVTVCCNTTAPLGASGSSETPGQEQRLVKQGTSVSMPHLT
eukprot:scaffold303287_cov19-Tisochrysis_lutea.AAC.1